MTARYSSEKFYSPMVGGLDSTALIAMDANREATATFLGIFTLQLDVALPKFDHAVFSDPGAEFRATYQTIAQIKRLLGDRLIITRKNGETITEWCYRLGTLPIMPGGSHICSQKFKGDVLAAWARAEGISQPIWLIGIEANEGGRAKRFSPPVDDAAEYRYPLVDLGLKREQLHELLQHLGWEPVRKSSCIFCPFMSEQELRNMYFNHSEEWQTVVEIEKHFQKMSPLKHQAWLDAGCPLDSAGRAPRGMWRKDSWANGARLFAKSVKGRRLSVDEWAQRSDSLIKSSEATQTTRNYNKLKWIMADITEV